MNENKSKSSISEFDNRCRHFCLTILYAFRAYLIFVFIAIIVLFTETALFNNQPDKWFGFHTATWFFIYILGPLNSIILLILYLLKLSRKSLCYIKILIIESLSYSLFIISLNFLNFIPKQMQNYSFLFPYIVIIPALIIYENISKKKA